MKNKEIEELLNKMKNCYGVMDYYLAYNEVDLLLSYIEQLEKELKEEQEDNYKQSQLLVEKQKKIEQLENNRDKAIEYNEHLIEHAKYHLNLGHLKKMRKILKGGSDE